MSAQSPAEFCAGVERHPRSDEQACGPDMREQFLQSPVSTGAKLESKRLDPWWKTAFSPTGVLQIFFPELTSSLQMNHTRKREAFLEPHGEAFLLWPFPSAEFSSICLLAFGVFLFGSYGVDATMKPTVGVGGTPVMHTITQSASSKAFVFLLGH